MQNAATVLAVIQDRGKRGLPLEGLYRQLFNPDLYLLAYGRISRNAGALTRGSTEETADGMSLDKIQRIIEAVRFERYRWTPVRRVEIPKSNGKTRPLGLPTWSDKLLQEVMRLLLEAYYEPQFSDFSHGFRPRRGCHTALTTVRQTWKGTKWFIEGDIKGCFDNIDHQVLLSILREHIHDNRFLRLLQNLLKAGYLENWHYVPTLSGTPQGGIISPLLSNIYLSKLDCFIANELLPRHNRGKKRRPHLVYSRMNAAYQQLRKMGKVDTQGWRLKRRELPTVDPHDPHYRRLHYVRYADDFLLGFTGPKAEAQAIKTEIKTFLQENLKLELSEEKTLITHAQSQAARFLGYEIVSQHSSSRRDVNGVMALRVPVKVITAKCRQYQKSGKVIPRSALLRHSDFTIAARFQSEYRGYVQYYALAQNLSWLAQVRWVMETAFLKTLAAKHQMSVVKVARKHRSTVLTPQGWRRCFKVTVPRTGQEPLVTYFGGLSLQYQKRAVLEDRRLDLAQISRNSLETRLQAQMCEICGSTEKVEVHHIRKLADLKKPGRREKPLWVQVMASMQRKTLVVCQKCHNDIHAGRPLTRRPLNRREAVKE